MARVKATPDESLEKLKEKLREGPGPTYVPTDGVSSGTRPLNLACSGNPDWAFPLGCFVLLVGDASSGKTFVANTCFAEAAIDPKFDDYNFIYDGPEYGSLMNMEKFFGRAAARIKPPKSGQSRTVEEMFFNLDDAFEKPCIYVEDSFDSLDTDDDTEKFQEIKKWVQKGRKGRAPTGSYGTTKAKLFSQYLRTIPAKLQKTKSVLVGISQAKTNIGFGSQFNPKTRGGGLALTFYNHLELWLSIKERLYKKERGHDVEVGIRTKIKVKRNRITGRECEVYVPIYWSKGIDDVGSMVDWLIDWKFWKESGDVVDPEGFLSLGGVGVNTHSKDELIKLIEDNNVEGDLKQFVTEKWQEVEKAVAVERKNKYA